MRISDPGCLLLVLVLGMLPGPTRAQTSSEHAALPYPTADMPKPIDRGALTAQSNTASISITIALKLRDSGEAENLLKSIHTPGDPQFHKFLTADQFAARFAPSEADVSKVITALAKYGLTAQRTTATTLKVTGAPEDMERAFAVSLRTYEVGARGNATAYTFYSPLSRPTTPAEMSASVAAVVGLDSRPRFRPHLVFASQRHAKVASAKPAGGLINPLGSLTVADFASYYDVLPLYNQGVTGKGRTIGIATLASFTPSDAFAYWSALGLSVDPNRIQIVNVDGGPGAPSDASGSGETTLDVEQSGGIAPGAKIIVYQAPNTNQGFIDLFAAAIDANSAQTISVSWGDWEWCTNLENTPFTCPTTPPGEGYIQALHELFVRAAIQGQTLFAASGDFGAYLNYADCPASDVCSLTLSVDSPADDTAITAAGGTTLPGLQEYCLNAACTPPYEINIPHESVWGWDYLEGLCVAIGVPDPIACGIFPFGSSGGVSIIFEEPLYQLLLPGIQRSQPGQSWIVNGDLVFALPSHYPGRNVPDVSFNADPNTGYLIYYTSDVTGFGIQSFAGGTSFVAPQLNGVSALLGQDLHSRLGLLNFPLYALAHGGKAYKNRGAPLRAIPYGDNWFYHGSYGYNLGVGLGTLDVANFAEYLRDQQ